MGRVAREVPRNIEKHALGNNLRGRGVSLKNDPQSAITMGQGFGLARTDWWLGHLDSALEFRGIFGL